MSKLLFSVAAFAIAAPAMAAPEPIQFERDGIRYVATVETVGAVTIIKGVEAESGKRFQLRLVNGHVAGQYGLYDVSYNVSARRGD